MSESRRATAPKPWKLLLEYLRAVLHQWVALMTGSLIVAAYALLPVVLPDPPGKKTMYLWNHLPPWVGWSLAVLALFVAQYRAWLDMRNDRERLRKEKDQEPERANVKGAIRNLFDAYRVLEIVSNRTNDEAWSALSQRLEEYKAAYALLPPVARRFHERSESVLTSLVHARMFERLPEVMNDASDMMLNGECWLDLTISYPHPMVITNRASRRDRFIILNMIVGSREDQAVSLFPVWHLYVDPGRMHVTYQPDAEPLKDWEELRREVPSPANPALAMPLQLSPEGAATGYWCFFIGNSLENDKRLLDGRRHIETVLEIHDLASGRRTKSDRFYLELDLIQSLLSPLPPEQADDGEPTPPADPPSSTASG